MHSSWSFYWSGWFYLELLNSINGLAKKSPWPNTSLAGTVVQSTNHCSYICKSSIALMWEQSSNFISTVRGSVCHACRGARLLLCSVWQVKRHLAKSQAFNEWTGGRCETSFRNCQEPVSKLKIMPLMLNKIDDPDAVKLKNSDMISGSKLIWHGHLDVQMTALYTWHKTCQVVSYP